ncbi:Scramblase-domain-containing protein [Protomyces lactucae-debilis]|uniref:Scramblase-domain-containing protein n=1 Tax=Protomyces lactucae-debilis TaxID=2754530 RepID=A0A1Y2F5B2_PROLT|nr:Scramblase-domain-containing protein [Protomyces lactucae-debilis]ORY79043.1 Scramblase-domain-containing protein [Protomyces lactucae-debilis]
MYSSISRFQVRSIRTCPGRCSAESDRLRLLAARRFLKRLERQALRETSSPATAVKEVMIVRRICRLSAVSRFQTTQTCSIGRAATRPTQLLATRGLRAVRSRPERPRQRLPKRHSPAESDTAQASKETAPVQVAQDADSLVRSCDAAVHLLSQPALVICRQIEMMNVFLGFEEANKYLIKAADGSTLAYMAEDSHTMASTMMRNLAGTHRKFSCNVLDLQGNVILSIRRGFALVNSHISVYVHRTPGEAGELIGEVRQRWNLTRRKYELFLHRRESMQQFGAIDEPMLSWDFSVMGEDGALLGSINRNMRGLMRELFTDTGHYVLRYDAASPETTNLSTSAVALPGVDTETADARQAMAQTHSRAIALSHTSTRPMTLDERAVLLATAVSVDFDYFSHQSGAGHTGFFPMFMPFPMFGGSAEGSSVEALPETTPGALPESEGGTALPPDPALGGTNGDLDEGQDSVDQGHGQEQSPVDDRPWWEQDQPAEETWSNDFADGDGGVDGDDWF